MDRPNGRRPSLSLPMNADAYQVSLDASPCPTSPSPKSIKSSRSRGRRNSNAFPMQSDVPELSSPQGWKHSRSSLALFIFYFVLSANDGIVKAKSRRVNSNGQSDGLPYALSSVMLMSCFVSLCTGILIACRVDGMRVGLQKCFDLTSILRIAPINALFQVAFVLKFEALRQLDPDIVSMLSQANLVFLAIAARLIMQKKYSSLQWRSLVQITLSMFVYLTNRDGGRDKEISLSPSQFSGYAIVMMMCIIETVATVLAEKFLKTESSGGKEKTPPFWIQKVHVDAAGLGLLLVCMFLPLLVQRRELDFMRPLHIEQILDNPFSGWDRWTVAVLIMVVFKAWLAGLVAKQLDSVVKQIGSCLAILLTYVEVILWIDPEGSSANASTLATFGLVLISILNFARSGESKRRSRSSRDLDGSERVPRDASYNSEGSLEGVLTSEKVRCEREEREDGANLNWTDHYKSSGLRKHQSDSPRSPPSPGQAIHAMQSIRPLHPVHSADDLDDLDVSVETAGIRRSQRYRSVHKTTSEDPHHTGIDDI